MLYPENKRNIFENLFPPHYASYSHPTIMTLLYLTRFENECAKLQPGEEPTIALFLLVAAQRFNPTFVEEYLELLRSTPTSHPFQGIQENLELKTINQIIDIPKFKQLSQDLSLRRFCINMNIVLLAVICYLLIEAYKPGLGINYTEKIMMVGVLFVALLKGEKAHLRFTSEKLLTEESKAYPMKNAGLFFTRESKTGNLMGEKDCNLNNSSSFTK